MARDVVGHLAEWVPAFFCRTWGPPDPGLPPVAADPAATWAALDAWVRARLDDPALAADERETPVGRIGFATAFDRLATSDVLVHTWDLARATGPDEALDPDEVHPAHEGMLPADEALRASGHFGPRVEVPADADEQARLLASLGRRP